MAMAQNSAAFRWIQEVDASGQDSFAGLGVDGQGNTYLVGSNYQGTSTTQDVYIFKLDPSGNIAYSKRIGGSGDDVAIGAAVDPSGDVYVTGTTTSADFPVTGGVYSSTLAGARSTFLFKLNPDGSTAYSTYFSSSAFPIGIAVDAAGSVYVAGSAMDGLPVTQGAFQSNCDCTPSSNGFFSVITSSGFVTKFKPDGTGLVYSTYIVLGQLGPIFNAMALAPDGSVYLAGPYSVNHLDPTGSTQLNSATATIGAHAMTVASDGSLYLAGPALAPIQGSTQPLPPIPGAAQSNPEPYSVGQSITIVAKMDSQLAGIAKSTYWGGPQLSVNAMTLDSAGNVYIGGGTGPEGLPTKMPLQGGFDSQTGFVSELSGDLSSVLFSSYFGDLEHFSVGGVGVGPQAGSVLLGGVTGQANLPTGIKNLWANGLTAPAAPARYAIDAVVNAASMEDGPISAGETIVIKGTGLVPSGVPPSLSVGFDGFPGMIGVTPIAITPSAITAVVPANVPAVAARVVAVNGVAIAGPSNSVLMPVAGASPGLFSQDGTGAGQGQILDQDGTLNTPSNPIKAGQKFTVFATGVGPVTSSSGYPVTQYPVNVFVDGWYCPGVSAAYGPVQGLPGNVYQITVIVPDIASVDTGFLYPAQSDVTMQVDGVTSPIGLKMSISN
jgi:uncharacterized protein (TIGR03437 family)